MVLPRSLLRPQFWFGAVGIWFAILFVLSSLSLSQLPGPQISHIDKLEHTLYFATGAACFHLGLRFLKPRRSFLFALCLAVLFCAFAGAFDEFHQTFTPNRSGNDLGDWLADVLGGFIGSFIGTFLYSRLKPKVA